jgi:hypothetical protein
MQAVQDTWMGLGTRRAVGVGVFVWCFREKTSRGPLKLFINDVRQVQEVCTVVKTMTMLVREGRILLSV